jgi:cyclopropane-fatty-acyl-phospholipid synthase
MTTTATVFSTVRWPALPASPRAPIRAVVARLIFERAAAQVPVRVTFPDGRVLGGGSPASPEFDVVRPAAFFARLGIYSNLFLGEA